MENTNTKTRVLIVGSKGRMGEALMRLAQANPALELAGGVDKGDNVLDLVGEADVLIEFAHHSLTPLLAEIAAEHDKALVIGTTGHTDAERASIDGQSQKIPIVFAPNYSVGVNLLFHLTKIAAQTLGEEYDREVVEMHHRHKLDAPSGTARRLAEILAEAAGGTYDDLLIHGRHGDVGARPRRFIGMHALRGGDVVGDHTVIFAADGERLELTHKASSRDTFASGALRAAAWVRAQKPGIYSMQDVLGLG
jgi:4-hydroxy-tetrahydrodipicolinate reductase